MQKASTTSWSRRLAALAGCGVLVAGLATAQNGPAPKQPAGQPPAQQSTTAPGKISWKAANQVHHNSGEFKNWQFTKVDIPGGDLEKGSVSLQIDILSLDSNSPKLTQDLLSDRFFKSGQFKTATVTIHDAKKDAADPKKYTATADVELLGVKGTVPVTFKVTSESPLKVEGEAKLDRTAFGVGGPYDPQQKFSVEKLVSVSVEATLPAPKK